MTRCGHATGSGAHSSTVIAPRRTVGRATRLRRAAARVGVGATGATLVAAVLTVAGTPAQALHAPQQPVAAVAGAAVAPAVDPTAAPPPTGLPTLPPTPTPSPTPPPTPVPLPPVPPALSPVDARMALALTARATPAAFGTGLTGQVVDVASGQVVWASRATVMVQPASTTKLVTAVNALGVYGPGYRFATTVRRGTSFGQLVLVGGGDPSLRGADLATLATTTAGQLRRHGVTRVKVWVDDSLFAAPSIARGWKPSYVPGEVGAVRALVVDGRHVADTSLDAGTQLAARLKAAGVTVVGVGRGRAAPGAPAIASVRGQRLDVIVRSMLQTSDNDDAEALHRLVAVRTGQPATWAGAALAQRQVAATEGLRLGPAQLYDGSGLSYADRLSAAQLVAVVAHLLDPGQPALRAAALTALPVAGVSGTLKGRYRTGASRCALGLVHAKTGTLDDAVALAGWATDAAGRVKAFAFVVNGEGSGATVRRRVDVLAATVTGCY